MFSEIEFWLEIFEEVCWEESDGWFGVEEGSFDWGRSSVANDEGFRYLSDSPCYDAENSKIEIVNKLTRVWQELEFFPRLRKDYCL
ncbi:MAG: hypothetical protein N2234_09550 [Planctomycetota bacterium]|nr:hypothetical protein [Planctomycetota bacterium]